MMNLSPDPHLTYDELLRTLVDISDLGPEQQAHLQTCHRCRIKAEELKRRYHRLGRMARNMAPEPARPFRVPAHQVPGSRRQFKPAMALAALGVLAFVFTVWWPRPSSRVETPTAMVSQEIESDARLMAEIDALVDDALPKAYQRVAVASEPIFSKDLIDWIVPSIDEDDKDFEPRA